jgi:adenylylsulfate kinase-like enzyme
MAKIYWLTGNPGSGKTTLGKKLTDFLSTDKHNWRSKVFHIDTDDVRNISNNYDYSEFGIYTLVSDTQTLSEFIYSNGCDVVVSISAPFVQQREKFKDKLGNGIVEFYLHNSKIKSDNSLIPMEPPTIGFFEIDTTKSNQINSFTRIIYYLKEK